MKQAYSVNKVITKQFEVLPFEGKWEAAIGTPECTGSWFIYGPPKNGKTSFAMQLAKYLTLFRRVAYNSVEEGLSRTIQMAMERTGLLSVSGKLILLDKESVEDLMERLDRRRSPDVIFIDSVQFLDLKFSEYKDLKARYPQKLFIYISHVAGFQPDGQVAKRIWRDANVSFRIEGFRAFPTGRYGGGQYINISEERANAYFGELEK